MQTIVIAPSGSKPFLGRVGLASDISRLGTALTGTVFPLNQTQSFMFSHETGPPKSNAKPVTTAIRLCNTIHLPVTLYWALLRTNAIIADRQKYDETYGVVVR